MRLGPNYFSEGFGKCFPFQLVVCRIVELGADGGVVLVTCGFLRIDISRMDAVFILEPRRALEQRGHNPRPLGLSHQAPPVG